MHSSVNHLQFIVRPENVSFYKELLTFLGWNVWLENDFILGMGTDNPAGTSLWFSNNPNNAQNDYDGVGLNHIGISVDAIADVDTVVEYLTQHKIQHLFETPRHRPEFAHGPDQTYYQVMFETPDRILVEVVYMGPQ